MNASEASLEAMYQRRATKAYEAAQPEHRARRKNSRKLTVEQVRAIRSAPRPYGWMAQLARDFHVSPYVIWGVVHGETYQSVL